jgi:poly(A) polymerase Pap1
MKYLVEIDADSKKGSELIKYIERLGANESEVHILNESPLTDEEMGLPPTRKVSRATLEALEYINKRREENAKSKKG